MRLEFCSTLDGLIRFLGGLCNWNLHFGILCFNFFAYGSALFNLVGITMGSLSENLSRIAGSDLSNLLNGIKHNAYFCYKHTQRYMICYHYHRDRSQWYSITTTSFKYRQHRTIVKPLKTFYTHSNVYSKGNTRCTYTPGIRTDVRVSFKHRKTSVLAGGSAVAKNIFSFLIANILFSSLF